MGAFGTTLVIISLVAVVVAIASFWGSGKIYRGLGRTGAFTLDGDEERRPAAPVSQSPGNDPVAREEIRQMLEAKSARREARGEAPLDIDAEMAALTASAPPSSDDALRDEVRQLVVARNERRVARGQEPLEVEAEVDRQLRDLGA